MENIHGNLLVKRAVDVKNSLLWTIQKELKFNYPIERNQLIASPLRELTNQVVSEQTPCLFISPHLDDAVISAGGIISYLSDKTHVSVANVFTDPNPKTDTKWALRCGYDNIKIFMENRIREDSSALKLLGVSTVDNLGFSAKWREDGAKPEGFDNQSKLIRNSVESLIAGFDKPPLIFLPVSEGRRHDDHRVTREVAKFFPQHIFWNEFRFYKDRYPKKPEEQFVYENKLTTTRFDLNLERKAEALSKYTSQIHALFPNPNVRIPAEKYFFSPQLLK